MAVTAYLVRGRAARLAVAGMALTTVTNVFMAAFGSAAFVQPGIGRAYLNGVDRMPALNADTVYGPALMTTALTSTAFFIVSAIVLGTGIARSHPRLRWYGVVYAGSPTLFAGSGILIDVLQPVAGFALAAVTAALAVRLPRVSIGPAADPARVRDTATVITG